MTYHIACTVAVLCFINCATSGCSRSDNGELAKVRAELEATKAELAKTKAETQAGNSESETPKKDVSGPLSPDLGAKGWDLEFTDTKGGVVKLRKADFKFPEESHQIGGGVYIKGFGGVPVVIGSGNVTVKWPLIERVDYSGKYLADDWKVTITMKDGQKQEADPYIAAWLMGEMEIGEYKSEASGLRAIIVVGPSK